MSKRNMPNQISLKYGDIRNSINNGDMFSFYGTNFFHKCIQWWTNSNRSHIGTAIWIKLDFETKARLCVFESILTGIRLVPLSFLLKKYSKHGGRIYLHKIRNGYDQKSFQKVIIDGNRLVNYIL